MLCFCRQRCGNDQRRIQNAERPDLCDYKASRDTCGAMKGNARDICVAEAKGVEKVARAELDAQYKPSARNDEKVTLAKADAAFDTAKEKCDDLSGNAKAARVKAREDAKVVKAAADSSKNKTEKMTEVKKDADGRAPVSVPMF